MPIGKVTLTCSDPTGPCGSALCSTCNPLRMFTDGTDTVIARSLDDVRAVLVAMQAGVAEFDTGGREHWREVSPERVVKIRDEETGITQEETVAAWIAERGRGFLCSTEA